MSLYDKASIALIPSGYKATTLYSVMPANGNGDFTHSRSNTTATRVNKDGLIENVSSNIPRLDYPLTNGLVGDCPHLLLEPTRTNRSQDTEAFQNWGGASGLVTANQAIAPDGNLTADELTKTSSFSAISRSNVFPSSGVDVVFSVFAKEDTTDNVTLRIAGSSNDVRRYFDLTNETSGQSGGNQVGFVSEKIEKYPNGWYRVSVVCTIDSTTVTTNIYAGRAGNTTYDGEIYIWGSQMEEGEYITSYIPNSSTTSTRSADACSDSGTSADINSEEGVLFVEMATFDQNDTSDRRIAISSGNTNYVIRLTYAVTSNRLYAVVYSLGTVWATFTALSNAENFNKVALKYKASDFDFYVNGVKVQQQSSGATFPAGTMTEVAFDNGGGGNDFYGKIKQLIVFNEALSDSELETLTS